MAPFSSVLISNSGHTACSGLLRFPIITGKCPRVELGVGFNLLEIQRDLISIFWVESSRRWRCCRAWGRWWEQSRFSQSASSSLRSSAPGPGPQEKLKKYSLKFVNLIKKSQKYTSEEYFLPLGLLSFKRCSLSHSASLHSEVTLLWKVQL